MVGHWHFARAVVATALLACGSVEFAAGAGYTFSTVADTSSPDIRTLINQGVEINDRGTTLFQLQDAADIFRAALGQLEGYRYAIENPAVGSFGLSGPNQLNEHDEMVFWGDGGLSIARDGVSIRLYRALNELTNIVGMPAINDAGQIVVHAAHNSNDSILVGTTENAPLRVLAEGTGPFSLSSVSPLISESGQVSYIRRDFVFGIRSLHIVALDGTSRTVQTGASSSDEFGLVRWLGDERLLYSRANGQNRTWWLDDGGLQSPVNPVVDGGVRIINLDANGSGDVVAHVPATGMGTAVYAGDSTRLSKLIGTWDDLNGRRVSHVQFSDGGINASGQIAFWATTYDPATGSDGRTGIYVATPGEIPVDLSEVIAATDFREPAIGSSSYTPGPDSEELGFSTVATPSGGNPLAAVGDITNSGRPSLSHRSMTATTSFDIVDLSDWDAVSISMVIEPAGGGYEAGDFLRISATDGVETLTLFELEGFADPRDLNDYDTKLYTWPLPAHWRQATLSISSFSNSGSGAEWYQFRQITFEGTAVPEPSSAALIYVAFVWCARRAYQRQRVAGASGL